MVEKMTRRKLFFKLEELQEMRKHEAHVTRNIKVHRAKMQEAKEQSKEAKAKLKELEKDYKEAQAELYKQSK